MFSLRFRRNQELQLCIPSVEIFSGHTFSICLQSLLRCALRSNQNILSIRESLEPPDDEDGALPAFLQLPADR